MNPFADVVIRAALPPDLHAVAALIDAMDQHYLGPGRSAGIAAAERMVQRVWSEREGTRFALAIAGGDAIGLACYVVIRPGDQLRGLMFLKDLFVVPEARSGGIGRAMMRWLAREAIALELGRIDVTTDEANVGAARLYDALGAERQRKIMFRYDSDRLARLADAE
ncbi:MAG: N-acetyltransferase family protein [Kofleriaceae bacterium]